MDKIGYFGILLLLLSVTVNAQLSNVGCLTYENGICVECIPRFYLDKQANCQPVNPLCQTYGNDGGCLSCYNMFRFDNGNCYRIIQQCAQYYVDKCTQCNDRYYLSSNLCLPVSPTCLNYSLTDGTCLSCIENYSISSGKCLQQPKILNCVQYSQNLQKCVQCQNGYTLILGKCQLKDVNCLQYQNSSCIKCNKNYQINSKNKCVIVSILCNGFNDQGLCLNCFQGFVLNKGQCLANISSMINYDPFCGTYQSGKCIKCYSFYYLDQNTNKCIQVDPLCQNYNLTTGQCLSCYNGYQLTDNKCQLQTIIYDPLCNKFQHNQCIKCSTGAYFNNDKKCILGDPQCKSLTTQGICLECYLGYILNGNQCIVNTEFNCNKWKNGICLICSFGYFKNLDNKCNKIDQLCAKFDYATSQCTLCYKGYTLSQLTVSTTAINNYKCILTENTSPSEVNTYQNCLQIINKKCVKCYARYYLNQQNKCQEVSPYCKTYDQKYGFCRSCYLGYVLDIFGACILM